MTHSDSTLSDPGPSTSSRRSQSHTPEPPTRLDPRLEATRQAMLLVNRIGMRATAALVNAGLGELSSNLTVAVLTHLAGEGPTRPRDLLRSTKLTRGGLSNLFSRLESAGLITRSYGSVPGDRRGAMVALTEAGSDAVSAISDIVASTLDSLGAEVAELAAALDSVAPTDPSSNRSSASTGQLNLLSLAGAAMTEALADVDPDDPTPSKTAIVLACAAQGGHTHPAELIESTGLSSGGVSQLLDRLEKADLIHRRTNLPPDRRVVTVELTARGHDRLLRQLTGVAEHSAALHAAVHEPMP